jgi:hypothetical protein
MRGTQKRVVYLKNTGSKMFEEAYFIIRENISTDSSSSDSDLIKEASRIINEHSKIGCGFIKREMMTYAGAFIIGALISFITTVLIF